jgi:hypothetical protein
MAGNGDDAQDFEQFVALCKQEVGTNGWTATTEKHGVVVSTMTAQGSALCVSRGVAVVAAPAARVRELAMDAPRRMEWDTLMASCSVLRTVSPNELVVSMISVAKWPVAARDFVARIVVRDDATGGAVVVGKSTKALDAEFPVTKGCVRGSVLNSGFLVEPLSAGSCRVTYVVSLDLCGWVPTSIVNKVMQEEPLALIGFRKLLTGSTDP